MPQATKEKSSYGEAFRAFDKDGADPAWFARLREKAFARFEERGFPTTDLEEWKYTNVAPIARAQFLPPSERKTGAPPAAEAVEKFVYEEARSSRLVFINGLYHPEFTALDGVGEGVVVSDVAGALNGEHSEIVRSHLARLTAEEGGAFVDLNTAFAREGAFLYVPAETRAAAPVQLLFLSTHADEATSAFPRVLVVVERGGELDIIENYAATGESIYFTNAIVEAFVADGARLTHYKVQDESGSAFHVAATHAELGRDSFYDLTTVTLGSRLSRHDIDVRFAGEGAECFVDGLYIVGDGQHADTHSLIDHRRPRCVSHQNYKGILDGKSRAVFNGKVFVHRDAQQTDARQSNKNLLLSTDARVDTKPQLEIFADDVKCAHGATVGQLEEEELFYLLSRGLHPDLARNLLTYGFAEEIVEKIKFDSIRAQLDEAIINRLHARLEV